jgi:branched-subunit amino acid ABC-type transport system permease component
MTWEIILQQSLSGLTEGMVLFVAAAGITLVMGSLKVLNLAHGSIYVIGLYLCFAVSSHFAGIPGHFYLAIIVGTLGAAIFGGMMEISIIRPVYKLGHIYQFLVTWGVIFIVMDLVKIVWGGTYHPITAPRYLTGRIVFSGLPMPKYNLLLIIFGFVVFIFLYLFINRTRFGIIIRGITVDREMMSLLGEDVSRSYTFVFMLGCGLAGLAGAVVGPITVAGPGMEMIVLLKSFIVMVIGGFGSLGGALIAALLIGLVDSFGILLIPRLALGFPFFLMLIVLSIRPWGILGKPE